MAQNKISTSNRGEWLYTETALGKINTGHENKNQALLVTAFPEKEEDYKYFDYLKKLIRKYNEILNKTKINNKKLEVNDYELIKIENVLKIEEIDNYLKEYEKKYDELNKKNHFNNLEENYYFFRLIEKINPLIKQKGLEFKGGVYNIIDRKSKVDKGVFFGEKGDEGIIVDYENDPVLQNVYKELKNELKTRNEPDLLLTVFNKIEEYKIHRKVMMLDGDYHRETGWKGELYLPIPLGVTVLYHKCVCRHLGILTALMLEKMKNEKLINGVARLNRNKTAKGIEAHAWCRYEHGNEIYILDVMAEFFGKLMPKNKIEDSQVYKYNFRNKQFELIDYKESWNYFMPEDF